MNFQNYAQKGESFVREIAKELGCPKDINKAGRIMRSTFQVLRNQTSPEESMQLISQLPMMIKAIYVDGWSIGKSGNRVRHVDDFLAKVREADRDFSDDDLFSDTDALAAVKAVVRVVRSHVSEGEIEDLRRTLPEELRCLLE